MKFYEVGGCVRDRYLGLKSKDKDYAVEASSYQEMKDEIILRGGQIFLESPKFFTIRATMPKLGAADYVLCRKDGIYKDKRHPDIVEMGTIIDDLSRRDFTINAIAVETETREVIDPFQGREDIKKKLIRCVGKTEDRLDEDPLRMLRALRFSITKSFELSEDIKKFISLYPGLIKTVSRERVREELFKMFEYDTMTSFQLINDYLLARVLFKELEIKLIPKTYEMKDK